MMRVAQLTCSQTAPVLGFGRVSRCPHVIKSVPSSLATHKLQLSGHSPCWVHSASAPAHVEYDPDDLMQFPDRLKWYESKFAADDCPDWLPATWIASRQLSTHLKEVTLEVEISREQVPLRNAYKVAGQSARIRVNSGEEVICKLASPPHAEGMQREALFRCKGDIFANETKTVKEPTSIKAEVQVVVSRKGAPEVYDLGPDDEVWMGPVAGAGLNLRGPGILAYYRFPTLVLMVEGLGIATARALIESPQDCLNLSLGDRESAVLYYKAPNDAALCYQELFEHWQQSYGVRVVVTTHSFQDAFDGDDDLVYDPGSTAAIILTAADEEAEAAALSACSEAEISTILSDSSEAKAPVYMSSTPMSFQMWGTQKDSAGQEEEEGDGQATADGPKEAAV